MSERWQEQMDDSSQGSSAPMGRRSATAEGQGSNASSRGSGQTGGSGSTGRSGSRSNEPIWQNRLDQMLKDAEQNPADGALTAGYKADPGEIVALLKRAQASEWSSFLQYWHHYFMASDIHSKEVQHVFKHHAKDEYEHARLIGERIQQLGGVPCDSLEEIQRLSPTPVEYGHDLQSMMVEDLIGERQTIDFYDEIIRTCGFDDNVTRATFEFIIQEEAKHADDFATLLYAFDGTTGKQIESVSDELKAVAKAASQERGTMRRTA